MEYKKPHPWWLLTGFWIGVAISLAVVARRIIALAQPSETGRGMDLDAAFSSHAQLTIAHIVPAAVFVLLAAWILLRASNPKWVSAAFFGTGMLTGLTAYAMSAYAIGGWVERSAVLVFNTWFLFSLGRAYTLYRHAEADKTRTTAPDACALNKTRTTAPDACALNETRTTAPDACALNETRTTAPDACALRQQRRWTTRAVGILLGIATTRPVMAVFFATSPLTHLQPRQFFGIAFWIGFSINAAVIELWLHSRSRARLRVTGLHATPRTVTS
jgi:hypothetical protein